MCLSDLSIPERVRHELACPSSSTGGPDRSLHRRPSRTDRAALHPTDSDGRSSCRLHLRPGRSHRRQFVRCDRRFRIVVPVGGAARESGMASDPGWALPVLSWNAYFSLQGRGASDRPRANRAGGGICINLLADGHEPRHNSCVHLGFCRVGGHYRRRCRSGRYTRRRRILGIRVLVVCTGTWRRGSTCSDHTHDTTLGEQASRRPHRRLRGFRDLHPLTYVVSPRESCLSDRGARRASAIARCVTFFNSAHGAIMGPEGSF